MIPLDICLALFLAAIAGCDRSHNGQRAYPVQGQVTYKGKPIAGAIILFRPVDTPQLQAVQTSTNHDGRFEVESYLAGEYRRGMVPGKYAVEIRKLELPEGPNPEPKNVLPAKYASAATSGLTANVQSNQPNVFTFALNE